MSDIKRAINWLRKEKNYRIGLIESTDYIDLAIEALENQERLKTHLDKLKNNYNKYDIMLIQEVIDIVDDCIIDEEEY